MSNETKVPITKPTSSYSLDTFFSEIKAKKEARTIELKGDIIPIICDDPPCGLMLRSPYNAFSTVDKQGNPMNPAKELFDAAFGPEIYEKYTNESDPIHCLSMSEVQITYIFIRSGFDMETVRAIYNPTKEEAEKN